MIRLGSKMRQNRKAYHGWKEDEKFFLSLEPRGKARNEYPTSLDALKEASVRHLPIIWENAKAIE